MAQALTQIWLTDSQTGKKVPLQTRLAGEVSFYSCGPTVYSFIHIGNLRAAMTADLIFRTLKGFGYRVTYVRNYTDIDDKIIHQAEKDSVSFWDVVKKYISEVEMDYSVAGLLEPTYKTRATEFLPEMIRMIETLIEKNNAYVNPDGEVFFSVRSFESYGKLSGRTVDEQLPGARVEVRAEKRDPADFTLWKPKKPGEPSWPSPWGEGRPGWHIECSAMSKKYLGDELDLHHGGMDLLFPHHENEIAQSECATGHSPYVRYWLHNAMLNINDVKMSKSLGNVLRARDALQMWGGELTRALLLMAHYRSILDLNAEFFENAVQGLRRIYEAKQSAESYLNRKSAAADLRGEAVWGSFLMDFESERQKFLLEMASDFNTPGAFASLFQMVRSWNRSLAEPMAKGTPGACLAATEFVQFLNGACFEYLGIGRGSSATMLKHLEEVRFTPGDSSSSPSLSDSEIEKKLEQRKAARAAKNFQQADNIRKELLEQGVEIKDGPEGATFRRVRT